MGTRFPGPRMASSAMVTSDWSPGGLTDRENLRAWLPKEPEPEQLSLF